MESLWMSISLSLELPETRECCSLALTEPHLTSYVLGSSVGDGLVVYAEEV